MAALKKCRVNGINQMELNRQILYKPKPSCERHSAINKQDERKAKQIHEPRYSKQNNSNYGKSN